MGSAFSCGDKLQVVEPFLRTGHSLRFYWFGFVTQMLRGEKVDSVFGFVVVSQP